MEVNLAWERLQMLILVLLIHVQSTANGDIMAIGLLAPNHVEEEKSHVKDQL